MTSRRVIVLTEKHHETLLAALWSLRQPIQIVNIKKDDLRELAKIRHIVKSAKKEEV